MMLHTEGIILPCLLKDQTNQKYDYEDKITLRFKGKSQRQRGDFLTIYRKNKIKLFVKL